MTLAEKIIQEIKTLPPPLQKKAFNFIEYLKQKTKGNKTDEEIEEWNQFSLESALSGMEDDEFPEYQESDFKEIWKKNALGK